MKSESFTIIQTHPSGGFFIAYKKPKVSIKNKKFLLINFSLDYKVSFGKLNLTNKEKPQRCGNNLRRDPSPY